MTGKDIKVCCLWSIVCSLLIIFIFAPYVFAYTYSADLDKVVEKVLRGDYYGALDECYRLEKNASYNLKGQILSLEGTCFLSLGEYDQARSIFKKALAYAKGMLSTELYMGIADTYFKKREYNKAISIYSQLLNRKTNADYKAMLYFKLGKAYQKNSKWAKSNYYFGQLQKKYPQSFEAQLVKKTSVGGNFFTIQVGCFSSKENAQRLCDDLKAKGYQVYITSFNSNGHKLYRVRVGEFVSRIAAEHTEAKLKTQEHLPTHIFP